MELYNLLARQPPIVTSLGGALITMVQAHTGREEAYNRWYEDDHYVPGAMVGPWIFAGRRFVRTELERFASEGYETSDLGSFITLYWTLDGHVKDAHHWIRAMWDVLNQDGRGPRDRTHVYSAMHALAFAHVFDPEPMKPIHALNYPYNGLAVEIFEAPNAEGRAELLRWLRDDFVPSHSQATGQVLAFIPTEKADEGREILGWADDDRDRRLCLLWFFRESPESIWPGAFSEHKAAVAAAGKGRIVLLAPFVPTLPGTRTPLDRTGK